LQSQLIVLSIASLELREAHGQWKLIQTRLVLGVQFANLVLNVLLVTIGNTVGVVGAIRYPEIYQLFELVLNTELLCVIVICALYQIWNLCLQNTILVFVAVHLLDFEIAALIFTLTIVTLRLLL